MRRVLILVPVVAVSGALAVPALAATKTVKVGDDYFVKKGSASTVTVKKNDTVKWNFTGKNSHNVKVKSGPAKFESPIKKSGSYSRKVTKAGLYTIVCTIHEGQTMKLRVK